MKIISRGTKNIKKNIRKALLPRVPPIQPLLRPSPIINYLSTTCIYLCDVRIYFFWHLKNKINTCTDELKYLTGIKFNLTLYRYTYITTLGFIWIICVLILSLVFHGDIQWFLSNYFMRLNNLDEPYFYQINGCVVFSNAYCSYSNYSLFIRYKLITCQMIQNNFKQRNYF